MRVAVDEKVLRKLDDAVTAWGGCFRLLCGRCWAEGRISASRHMGRAEAVRKFYNAGWRCADVTLCPHCGKSAQSVEDGRS